MWLATLLLPLLLPAAAAFVPTAFRAAAVTRRDPACRATSLPVCSESRACGAAGVLDLARAVVARAEEEARVATAAREAEESRAMEQAQAVLLLASLSEMEAGEATLAEHARLVEAAQARVNETLALAPSPSPGPILHPDPSPNPSPDPSTGGGGECGGGAD